MTKKESCENVRAWKRKGHSFENFRENGTSLNNYQSNILKENLIIIFNVDPLQYQTALQSGNKP